MVGWLIDIQKFEVTMIELKIISTPQEKIAFEVIHSFEIFNECIKAIVTIVLHIEIFILPYFHA